MAGKAQVIRFVVGSPTGFRASTWRCWAPSGTKSDVYLAPRALGWAYKLSLHEGGYWQVAFTSEYKRKMVQEGRWKSLSRVVTAFPPTTPIRNAFTLAFRVVVPHSAVSIASDPAVLPQSLIWIPTPAPNASVEVSLFITAVGSKISSWPGSRGMGTKLVGDFGLPSGEHLWLVHREDAIPTFPEASFSPSFLEPEAEWRANLGGKRAILLIRDKDRPLAFMECCIQMPVAKTEAI